MPIYEIEVAGKVHEIESDKDLSDSDLGGYAKSLAAPEAAPAPAAPKVPRTTMPVAAAPTPGFGARVRSEFDRVKGVAGEIMRSLAPPAEETRRAYGGPNTMPQTPGGPMLAPTARGGVATGVKTAVQALGGLSEAPIAAATGAGATLAGGVAGAGNAAWNMATDDNMSTSDALARGGEVAQNVMSAGTYQPRTKMGKVGTELLNAPFTMAAKVGKEVGGAVGRVAGDEIAGEVIGENLPAAVMAGKAAKDLNAARGGIRARGELTQKQKAIEEAKSTGYVGPGTAHGALNTLIEGLGGEREIIRKQSRKNQMVTDQKAREGFGLDKDAELTPQTFNDIRDRAGVSYEEVKRDTTPVAMDGAYDSLVHQLTKDLEPIQREFPGLGNNPKIERLQASLLDKSGPKSTRGILDTIKKLRSDATTMFRSADANEVSSAFAYRAGADALEAQLDRHFAQSLSAEKMDAYRAARKDIAASYDLESATNPVTGQVDAAVLGRLLDKGRPLSGTLLEIARAAQTFPKTVRNTERLGSSGLHASDVGMAGVLSYAVHHPGALLTLGARPLASTIGASGRYGRGLGAEKGQRPPVNVPVATPAAALTMSNNQNLPWRSQDEATDR